jgi:DNA polymerase-3 subunit gamma/tau
MVASGADLRQLNSQLGEEWRALLLARAGANVAEMMDRSEEDSREISALAERFTLEELSSCARLFARNETPARGFPLPQMALELSFLDCVQIRGHGTLPVSRQVQPVESAPTSAKAILTPEPELHTPAPATPSATPASAPTVPPRQARPGTEKISSGASSEALVRVQSQWDLVKQVCKQRSHSVAALLHSAQPIQIELGGDVPVLVLEAAYQFHLDKLREPASKAAVEWALEQVLSQPLRVKLTLRAPSSDGSAGARSENTAKFPAEDGSGSGPGAVGPAMTNVTPIRRPLPPSALPTEARNPAGAVAQVPAAPFPTAPILRVDPDPAELEAEVRADPVIRSLLRIQGIELVNIRARKESD